MTNKFNGIIFKDKRKLLQNFNSLKKGNLVKIFIPDYLRGKFWNKEKIFIYGMALAKKSELYYGYNEFSIKILMEQEIYLFTWRQNTETKNVKLLRVIKLTASQKPV